MKIRNGFVSNSSSSSFIVALEKKPESKEEVKEIFFPNKRLTSLIDKEHSYNVLEAVKDIWLQIRFWDERLSEDYIKSEMSMRLYNKSKSNELEYYGTDEMYLKKYKEVSKKFHQYISRDRTYTKERMILYNQKCKRFDIEMNHLFECLYNSDLFRFYSDCIINNKNFFCVLEFSTEGSFWSPLEWTDRWLKNIPYIKISKH